MESFGLPSGIVEFHVDLTESDAFFGQNTVGAFEAVHYFVFVTFDVNCSQVNKTRMYKLRQDLKRRTHY